MAKEDIKKALTGTGVNRRQFLTRTTMGAGALMLMGSIKGVGENFHPEERRRSPKAWSFGVMADTQWTLNGDADDGYDPNSCTAYIAEQIQQAFINAGVAFVVHVGDLQDKGGSTVGVLGESTRALYAQSLYNAGIGFFPLRGNHDDGTAIAAAFLNAFPQTQTGLQNQTLKNVNIASLGLTAKDIANLGLPSTLRPAFTMGRNFSSPDVYSGALKGLTYSFDFGNARFILLDQFTPVGGWPSGYDMSNTINAQQPWITGQLQGRPVPHAFVFAHKGLLTCNHADVLFSESTGTPADNPSYTDAFMASLADNNVKYYIHGHDHMHDRSIVTDTAGKNAVHQLLCASDSSKFYVPQGANSDNPQSGTSYGSEPLYSNDQYYDVPAFNLRRRTPVSQELNLALSTSTNAVSRDIGFYIFTVDGPNVTADYYAVTVPVVYSAANETLLPTTTGGNQSNAFTKRETFGYSLNGNEFLIPSGSSYSSVKDSSPDDYGFVSTSAQILSGTNSNTITDANGVSLTKAVHTGWAPQEHETISDILTLWGMGSLGVISGSQVVVNPNPDQTDTYVLQLKFDRTERFGNIAKEEAGLAALDRHGNWVNAVKLNTGAANNPKFVNGPWKAGYGLGTYGVNGNKAWAVINFQGQFAVACDNK